MPCCAGEVEDDHLADHTGDRAAIGKAGKLRADLRGAGGIDLGETETRRFAAHVEHHFAPRVDHQAVAVGLPAVGMMPHLRGGDDLGARLDRAGALEQVPVRLRRWAR